MEDMLMVIPRFLVTLNKCNIILKTHTPYRIFLSRCGHNNVAPNHTCFQSLGAISSVCKIFHKFLIFNNKKNVLTNYKNYNILSVCTIILILVKSVQINLSNQHSFNRYFVIHDKKLSTIHVFPNKNYSKVGNHT